MVIPVTATIAAGRRRRRSTVLSPKSRRIPTDFLSSQQRHFKHKKDVYSNLSDTKSRREALNRVNHLLQESLRRFAWNCFLFRVYNETTTKPLSFRSHQLNWCPKTWTLIKLDQFLSAKELERLSFSLLSFNQELTTLQSEVKERNTLHDSCLFDWGQEDKTATNWDTNDYCHVIPSSLSATKTKQHVKSNDKD